MNVGRNIRNRREELGLSQHQLADQSGVEVTALCRYESGIRLPTVPALYAISKALGVSMEWLLET